MRAYRFTLDPTRTQLDTLAQHAGAARWAYNHALATKLDALRRRQLQIDELVTLGLTEQQARRDATVTVPSKPQVQKRWNQLKGDTTRGGDGICPWWRAVSTYAFQSAFLDADRAWKNWMDSLTGKRAGRRVGAPRFKKKGRCRDSFRLHHAVNDPTIRLEGYRRLRMPRLGSIRLHDSGKRLARALARGGRVQSVTVSRGGHRWYASVLVDEPDHTPGRETQHRPSRAQHTAGGVGVDVGVHHLAALSTGETLDNPRHLHHAHTRLVKAQRALARTQKGSHRRRRAAERVGRLHHQLAERRASHLHTITKRLATQHALVAVEDLNVQGMTRTARGTLTQPGRNVRAKAGLNRAILDAAPGELRRQLEYKASWYGSTLAVCDRWAPTSKTCSTCGTVKTKLPLSTRVYRCDTCGMVCDRDINAARNILKDADPVAPGRGETLNACGGPVSPSAPHAPTARPSEAGRPGHPARSPRGNDPPSTPKTE
ncbi:transposase [Saccharomonospora piscinae]|nr:transposase [Saccharomonospora piscinae]